MYRKFLKGGSRSSSPSDALIFFHPKNIVHSHYFQFLLGITVIAREIEDTGYAKFLGVNKVHYGLGEKSEV